MCTPQGRDDFDDFFLDPEVVEEVDEMFAERGSGVILTDSLVWFGMFVVCFRPLFILFGGR